MGGELQVTYTPAHASVVLSGTVRERKCERPPIDAPNSNACFLRVVPAGGQLIELGGRGRSLEARTNESGVYRFRVKRGSYTIRVSAQTRPKGDVMPVVRSVHARADVGNLDFTFCRDPQSNSRHLGCDLVEIIGRVFDVHGNPYHLALVAAVSGRTDAFPHFYDISDQEYSDRSGDFGVFAPRGTVTVAATGDSPVGHAELVLRQA